MKKLWVVIILVIVVVVMPLCLLSFGNPQWNKYIYMWQYYVWTSGTTQHLVDIPLDDEKIWRSWHRNGQLMEISIPLETHYLFRSYNDTGVLLAIECLKRGDSELIDIYSVSENIDDRKKYRNLLEQCQPQ